MSEQKKFDCPETQQQLINKLEELFKRENLENDVYFIARMNDKMEIPLQVVYQQKEIYKICPNGRYVLQALKQCDNIIVNQESLYVIPKILPKKIRIYIRISDSRKLTLDSVLTHIQEKSQIVISHNKIVSPTSAILTVESEENAIALSNWIAENKIQDEPQEIQLREENLYKVFRSNVKEDLSKYYEKLNEDKKASEMYENLSFFSNQSNFPTANRNRIGENIFSNPFNYFFFQQPAHEQHNLQPSIRKSNGEPAKDMQNQQQFNPLAYMMFQQPTTFNGPQNSRRNNNHIQNGSTKTNKNNNRGQDNVNKNNNSLNRSQSKKKQNNNGKFSDKNDKKNQKSNFLNKSGEKTVNTNKNNKKNGAVAKKTKPQKPLIDNEENFPTLSVSQNTNSQEKAVSRQTRKSSAETRQNTEASPVLKEVTIKVISDKKDKKDRLVSESKERQRQVSESRERQIPSKREKSQNKTEEVVYVRKGKDIRVTYDKESLIEIFKKMKDQMTAPNSIIEASKDDFIPVININAAREIEYTKPTEVELLPLSNPGTPYQQTASIPYRKASISRSNIKRKQSDQIVEVDENKV